RALCPCFFFLLAIENTLTSTLSVHDALPIFIDMAVGVVADNPAAEPQHLLHAEEVGKHLLVIGPVQRRVPLLGGLRAGVCRLPRSEEHTSELQSPCKLVCPPPLEKKKQDRQR